MRAEKNNILFGIDPILILLYILLVSFGWVNIYAASTVDDSKEILDFSTTYGKQLLWIILSIPLIILILFLNSKFYENFAGILYIISLVLLTGVLFFGKNINGATSWYSFGGFSIQPSEFVKVFTALALGRLLGDKQYSLKLIKNQIKSFAIIFTPAILIILQPDIGSVLIYLSFIFVLNREGLTLNYIILGVSVIILFMLTLLFGVVWIIAISFSFITILVYIEYINKQYIRHNWHKIVAIYMAVGMFIVGVNYIYNNVFEQYQRNRFDVLLGKVSDTKNIGYNTFQSIKTISSGGFSGKGFLQGDRTQGRFVPEQHTDYIFSTVGEEWGFIGSSAVIILFMLLLYRIIYLSETHKSKFSRIYGYSLASILFFHLVINISMVIGLLPTIGIPLPFFSYGGSSLWSFTLFLFIFIKLDANKSYNW